jgi:alginate production protein
MKSSVARPGGAGRKQADRIAGPPSLRPIGVAVALLVWLGLGHGVGALELPDRDRKELGADAPPGLDAGTARTGRDQALLVPERVQPPDRPFQMAQFQLPQPSSHGGPPRQVVQFLKYQYSYGSESDITYRRDPDLDRGAKDNTLILAPQLNGIITYRPTAWLDATLEVIVERDFASQEEKAVTLPGGESLLAEKRAWMLAVDQAYVRIHGLPGPFELMIGRRNFEDDRRWLFDTSLDAVVTKFRKGAFQVEASVSRKDWRNLVVNKPVPRGHVNNYMLYVEYRGIEDSKLAGYVIRSHDSDRGEGRPIFFGLRAYGAPTARLSYWAELAAVRGRDELSRRLSGHGLDIGATYRFLKLPLTPNFTLGYAHASGDANPDDDRNNEFRQTGLQSNETRFAGLSKFKVYGEGLDPELSNIRILTAGLGFRAAKNTTVDIVYHRYRLDEFASSLRSSPLTAEMNRVAILPNSRDVGKGIDLVIGLRNLFGVRRLGLDLRGGWFFPGDAFRRNVGDDENPRVAKADRSISVLAKFWW